MFVHYPATSISVINPSTLATLAFAVCPLTLDLNPNVYVVADVVLGESRKELTISDGSLFELLYLVEALPVRLVPDTVPLNIAVKQSVDEFPSAVVLVKIYILLDVLDGVIAAVIPVVTYVEDVVVTSVETITCTTCNIFPVLGDVVVITVPVLAGSVSVFVPATAGDAIVIAPEVFPVNTISAIMRSPMLLFAVLFL
tara:strand:- start:85 stop:678 length:594 start_codon:yes stop_codon:yes gene_type:complete